MSDVTEKGEGIAAPSGADLPAILGDAGFPAALWSGAELRFLWANRPFLDLIRESPPEVDALGMPVSGFLSDTRSAMLFQDAAYTGLPKTEPEYEYRASSGDVSYWQLTFLPVPGRFGQPCEVLLTGIDVTGKVRAERAAEHERTEMRNAMDLIDTTILSSLDAEEILQRVVVEATEALGADWGWIARRAKEGWVFRNVHGWPEESVGRWFREDEESLPRLAAERGAVVVEGGTRSVRTEHRELLERHDIGGFLLVPLLSRGDVGGVVGFCWNEPAPLGEAHRELADKLAVSLALALENARLYAAEREIVRTLQSAFLALPHRVEGLEFAHLYHSSANGIPIGADFYDLVQPEAGLVAVMLGGVSGRGLPAASMTALVKNSMRAEALRAAPPTEVVTHTSEIVRKEAGAGSFATAFFGVMDVRCGEMSYCLAGPPAPVLAPKGAPPSLLSEAQAAMGLRSRPSYGESRVGLSVGDLLVLYTEGLTDAADGRGRPFGTKRLLRSVADVAESPVDEIPQALFMDAFSYADGRMTDDVAILAMRRTEPRPRRAALVPAAS
ncbi:MAG: SpoIIE family protein phosphatase [Coriobacteriia bacterium]|nr:SpoIIE family protein phosphatase [Coriobacteriia bacterium]